MIPVPAGQPAATQRREQANARLREAQAALEQAAAEDARLREALTHRGDPDPGRRVQRALQDPLVAAVATAEANLSALPAEQPAVPFSYPLTEHLRACTARARLTLERPGREPLQRTIEGEVRSADTAHPAFPEQGLGEDPLVFSRSEAQDRHRALAALAAELDALLAAERDTRGLATPPVGAPPADPATLETATRRLLLALMLDRTRDRPARAAWLAAAFGLPDLDGLPDL